MATEETEDRDESPATDFAPATPPPLTLTEPDADDGDEETEEKVRDPKTGKWTAKKQPRDRQRGRMRGELDELRTQNTTLQAKLDAFTASSQSERNALFALLRQPARQEQQQQDQPASEVKDLRSQLVRERELLARDPKRSTDSYDELTEKLQRAIARSEWAALNKQNGGQQQQRQQQSPDVQAAIRQSQMESEFPWIAGNEKAMRAAANYRNFLIESGKPATIETLRLAIAHVGATMGLGGANQPSQRQRQAMAAPGPGAARNGAPRQVTVADPRMLSGTGLSKERLNKALFEKDDE